MIYDMLYICMIYDEEKKIVKTEFIICTNPLSSFFTNVIFCTTYLTTRYIYNNLCMLLCEQFTKGSIETRLPILNSIDVTITESMCVC